MFSDTFTEEDLKLILIQISSKDGKCLLTHANIKHAFIRAYFAQSGGSIEILPESTTQAYKLELPHDAQLLTDFIRNTYQIDLDADPHALDSKPMLAAFESSRARSEIRLQKEQIQSPSGIKRLVLKAE